MAALPFRARMELSRAFEPILRRPITASFTGRSRVNRGSHFNPPDSVEIRVEPDLEALLSEIAGGDEIAFETFYVATVDRCFALARSILSDHAWAEDCAADVYSQVWRTACEFDAKKGSAVAWLVMISRTRAIDLLRRERRHLGVPWSAAEISSIASPASDASFGGLIAVGRLKRCLAALSEVQKRMVELAFFNDLSHGEIARTTGIPIGTVKSHLRRALAALKQGLVVTDES